MFYEIFTFELKYRLKRPETYAFFLFLLLFSMVGVEFIFQGVELGLVQKNSPLVVAKAMGAITGLSMLIASMIMGVPILRDFKYNIESLIYVTPLTKRDYLLGRYLGSLVVLLFIFSAILWGMMLGEFMPWTNPLEYSAFDFTHYLQPFIWVALPIIIFGASVFYITGALSKNMILVYTQGIFIFVLFMLTKAITNETAQALLDPFSLTTLTQITKEWTTTERNFSLIPVSGIMLFNKALWSIAGLLILLFGYYKLKMNVVANKKLKWKLRSKKLKVGPPIPDIKIYEIFPIYGIKAFFPQLLWSSSFHARAILKQSSFWSIVICTFVILIVNSVNLGTEYGVDSYPATYLIIEELQEMSLYFFLIILLFYSAELLWKERENHLHLICDSTPYHNFTDLASKIIGLLFIYIILIFSLILSGIIFQMVNGYFSFDLGIYFSGFFLEVFPFLILYTIIAVFFLSLFGSKYLGILATLIFFIVNVAISIFGIEHVLVNYPGGTLSSYSEMNIYGHSMSLYLWGKLHWLFFGILLIICAATLKQRGVNVPLRKRWKSSFQQAGPTLKRIALVFLLLFITSTFHIYYNTNIINEFWTEREQSEFRAEYEKLLKPIEYVLQPKIVDVNLKVDLYPSSRSYKVKGQYKLINSYPEDLNEIHIQKKIETHIHLDSVTFDREVSVDQRYEKFDYTIYHFIEPLKPGDSLRVNFVQTDSPKGFEATISDSDVVFNGTFFDNSVFPSLGYQRKYELKDEDQRNEFGLSPRISVAKKDDVNELKNSRSGSDSDGIDLEVVLSTSAPQTAITSGNLLGQWSEKERNYFHYKSNGKMIDFYALVSADYAIKSESFQLDVCDLKGNIDLEIYYQKGHEYNLDRMMESMKQSLKYYSNHFSPYQYSQLRIMEFPRNRKFAQSFPNAIPFSEALGFIMDIDDKDDVDMVYYITAHEVAHQWWGSQVEAANVQGRNFILETLSQYSALMVLKDKYGDVKLKQFLALQFDAYKEGKRRQDHPETPLIYVEKEEYIYYEKGALIMYLFADCIGEEKVNLALNNFLRDWSSFDNTNHPGRFATSLDLIRYFRAVTPDSLQYKVSELFEEVVEIDPKSIL